jgi:hypothetical protein
MPYQTLFPDAILASANYTAPVTVGNIDNGVSSADTVYLDANGGGQTQVRVSFPTPTQTFDRPGLVGIQTFRCSFRRRNAANSGTGGQNVTATLTLFENGTTRNISASATNTGATNVTAVLEVNASTINPSLATGSGVELLVAQTAGGVGGGAATRSYVEVNEIEWISQTPQPYTYQSYNWGEVS